MESIKEDTEEDSEGKFSSQVFFIKPGLVFIFSEF